MGHCFETINHCLQNNNKIKYYKTVNYFLRVYTKKKVCENRFPTNSRNPIQRKLKYVFKLELKLIK